MRFLAAMFSNRRPSGLSVDEGAGSTTTTTGFFRALDDGRREHWRCVSSKHSGHV